MFTINIKLRFALMAVLILGGILLSVLYGFWYGFPFWLSGLILLVGYILLGTVQSAAQLVQAQQLEEARERLKLTLKPDWLYTANRAYYYLINGTIAVQTQQLSEAEGHFNKSLEIGLPSDNETAMVHMQLANIAASKSNWTAAKRHMRETKQLSVTEPMMKQQLAEMEKAMKQQGQMKHMNRPGAHRRGFRQKPRRK